MFRTRFKRQIVTEFLPPARAGTKQKVILLCDGMPSIPRKQPLADFLAAKGYWAFILAIVERGKAVVNFWLVRRTRMFST
jgi:hypothetical protein